MCLTGLRCSLTSDENTLLQLRVKVLCSTSIVRHASPVVGQPSHRGRRVDSRILNEDETLIRRCAVIA